MKEKPNLSFWGLWNLSFGFFGVQIAYALQSANISRIFATLGADPHNLSYFWILPPLMGIIVQPIVGTCSDKTWCRFGRRIPYLFIGAAIAVLVMCLLPNSGSFGMTVSTAMTFGLIALMFLDTSINMAMQPAEGCRLFHSEFSVQRRFAGGLCLPVCLCTLRHCQHRTQGCRPRLGHLQFLCRSCHPHPLRHLHRC